MRGRLRSHCGGLLGNELLRIVGLRDRLLGELQWQYGIPRHTLVPVIDRWLAREVRWYVASPVHVAASPRSSLRPHVATPSVHPA